MPFKIAHYYFPLRRIANPANPIPMRRKEYGSGTGRPDLLFPYEQLPDEPLSLAPLIVELLEVGGSKR